MTLAADIRLESLGNGPGLLPFNLGKTKLIVHYHSFLQYIDLINFENQLNSIETQLDYFKTKLDNQTFILYELQINYLSEKLIKINSQLKSLEPNRMKRGLVDGFGSIIKSITGNLDQTDAEKYDKAIKVLESNENKLVSELNEHITLNKEWMTQHAIILTNIAENQVRLNKTLELILNNDAYAENSLLKFGKFAQLLAIISENAEDLVLELNRIEDILAFTRASSTHHRMLSISNLGQIIGRLRNIYGKDEILESDLREYYSIIKPGYYYVDKRIVIILKFPIVSPRKFELFKLSIVPNKFQQTFIPTFPFIATDGKAFFYIEAECPKFNQYHLCTENVNHQARENKDCIQTLITRQFMEKTCRPTQITLTKEAMEQLDDQHYTIIFPKPTRVELDCGRREFITANGSYLATIPQSCSLHTDEFTIINTQNQIRGRPMKITEISENYYNTNNFTIPHIHLKAINFKGLRDIEDKIIMHKPIELNHEDQTIYHTTIPFYVLLIITLTGATALFIRRYLNRRKPSEEKDLQNTDTETPTHTYEDPEKIRNRKSAPATFALKVLK